jgi:6-phosphogluconate dehydrogenase (decarboxylating)
MKKETTEILERLKREFDAKSVEIAKSNNATAFAASKQTEERDRAVFQTGQSFGLWMATAFIDCMIGGSFELRYDGQNYAMFAVSGPHKGLVIDWGKMNVFTVGFFDEPEERPAMN